MNYIKRVERNREWFSITLANGAPVKLETFDYWGVSDIKLVLFFLSPQDLQKLATEAQKGASELKAQERI